MALTSEDSVNYKVTQGDNFVLQLTYNNPNGTPYNLAGYTFSLEVRDKPGGKVICATCSLGDGITVSNVTTGIISINITSAKTNKFVTPKSAYQLQATDSYGKKVTLLQGWFLVNPGVIS